MRISFPFLCAKDLCTSLLIMRTHSFFSPVRSGYIRTRTRRRPAPSTCSAAFSCNGDRGSYLMTSTVGNTPPRGWGSAAVGRTPMPTLTRMRMRRERREAREAIEGGDLVKDKELIGRGEDDTVDAAGRRCGGGAGGGRGRGLDKAPREDRGVTPEGRGEGQSPRAVGSRGRPEEVQGRFTRTGYGYDASGRRRQGGGRETGRGRRDHIHRCPPQMWTVVEAQV